MTFQTQKDLVIAAVQGRTEKALAQMGPASDDEELIAAIADFIWDAVNVVELLSSTNKTLITRKLDAKIEQDMKALKDE